MGKCPCNKNMKKTNAVVVLIVLAVLLAVVCL